MAIEWSSSGLDLHLDWPPGQALADALRSAVREGRLKAGTAVPSTRTLAADLGIAKEQSPTHTPSWPPRAT
jgi:GntR family transcriptional regulator/MocR family aminotransferase